LGDYIPFTVAGIGPGESGYRIPAADQAAVEADLLIGGERHLALFHHLGKEALCLSGKISLLPDIIRERWLSQKITILVSGDPGYHSLLGLISRNFAPREYHVIPGISSFQLAAARTGKPWQDDLLLSLHGRVPENWKEIVIGALDSGKRVFFLTDSFHSPRWIGENLYLQRLSHCKVSLFYLLGHEEENVDVQRLSHIVAKPRDEFNKEPLCVMIINPPSM
jgi:precorrin-6y C5,15-methyltransferase (decarboxylating) CbiE subunit